MSSTTTQFNCIQQVCGKLGVQETYPTGSADLRGRAAQLRKLGFQVTTGNLGMTVTQVGYVKMSVLLVRNVSKDLLPPVNVAGLESVWEGA